VSASNQKMRARPTMDRTGPSNMGALQAQVKQDRVGERFRRLVILLDVSAPELGHARIGKEDEHGTVLVSKYLGGFQSVGASA
jgi:hypothetical protein